jgi:hypothetical protein
VVGSHFTATGVPPVQAVEVWLWQTMFGPQSASVAQGAAWQLIVGVVVTTGVHVVPPSLAKQGAAFVTASPAVWHRKPLVHSASVVQVWARPRPGAMRVVAIAIVPTMSFADGMLSSSWFQFETPTNHSPAFCVPGRATQWAVTSFG